jgi:hypothetical protein
MYGLGIYAAVRLAKMCRFSAPPRYQRTTPAERHRLGSFLGAIDAILEADKRALAKQRHTAQRIYERLRSENGYAGGLTVVNGVRARAEGLCSRGVCAACASTQVDLGEPIGILGGVRQKMQPVEVNGALDASQTTPRAGCV